MPSSKKKSSSQPKKAAKTASSKKSTAQKKATAKKTSTAKKSPKQSVKKATKKTTKKSASKKSSTTSSKVLVCAEGEECFWTTDGEILKDLRELRDVLKDMDPAVFAVHVSNDHNDFAQWVEYVLQDEACAADLRSKHTPHTARSVVVRHLKHYSV